MAQLERIDVVIIGAGGFGREVLQWARDQLPEPDFGPALKVIGFVDDDAAKHGTQLHGLPVLGDLTWLAQEASRRPGMGALLAVGSPKAKQAIATRLHAAPLQWPVLLHKTVVIGNGVTIGRGSILCPRTTVTVDVAIGEFCTANLHCTIGHDAKLGSYVTLAPGSLVSGFAQLHDGCELGTGVVVIPSAQVGEWSVVGAGATVVKDVPAHCTAVGTPARPLAKG